MARVAEVYPFVQVGVRSTSREEAERLDRDRVLWARDIHEDFEAAWGRLDRMIGDRVYVTVDLDVLDPSCFPATGTPEPGGLDWYEMTKILRRVGTTRRVVGLDLMEHSPRPGLHAADYLAARLLAKALLYFWGETPETGG
jgi:agmatinase